MKRNWTGERLETFITSEVMLEHLHRYAIAQNFVSKKNILDIACGEGYGTYLLSNYAEKITGIDIDSNTINKAKKKYTNQKIKFKTGSILEIPENKETFDVVICLETLEHIDDHEAVIAELKRVLKKGGVLIISTPNKFSYSRGDTSQNPFHKKELSQAEFQSLLLNHFKFVKILNQVSFSCSLIEGDNESGGNIFYTGDYSITEKCDPPAPMFYLAFASDEIISPINTSSFLHKDNLTAIQANSISKIKSTITFKVGNILLLPFKLIVSLFQK
jgi:2-polyprenyl-3-methyl-5-hydroxy-6-metoxy-1,4-benzoquinol methylase